MSLTLNTLRIVCVYNPFESIDYREEKIVKLENNAPVSEYIKKYFEEIPQTEEVCACYNGSYVKHDFIIQHGGLLTFTVIPSGGDNMSLRMLAAISIVVVSSIVAPGAGTAIASSALGVSSEIAATTMTAKIASLAVAAAINIGGMMLLNAIWPVPVPKDVKSGSRTYSFSGASNSVRDGDVLPDLIGTCRFAPPLIGAYRSLDGDISSIQYINLLYAIGDISDGIPIVMKDLDSTTENDPLKTGYKVFLNNSEQSMTELDRMQTSLVYVNDTNYADQLESTAGVSINTYFNNTVHEIDIGKQIPLDIHYEESDAVSTKTPKTSTYTHNGYSYKSLAVAANDPNEIDYNTFPPSDKFITDKNNVTTAKISFSFCSDKAVIDRVAGDIDIQIPGTIEGETITTKQDILKVCWDCVCKYRVAGSGSNWLFKRFSIFSPEWNGTNEINGGLWFEESSLDHPDDDADEIVVESDETRGSQYSFSVLFPSANQWEYGFECYSTRVFFSESRKVTADYTTGVPTITVPDFVEVVQYEECTPDAVSEFEVDALYDINELTVVCSFPSGVVQYSTKDNSAKYLELNILIGIKRTDSSSSIEKTLTVRKRTRTPFRYALHFSSEDLKNLDGVSTKYIISAVYVGNEKDFAASNKVSTCVIDYVQMIKSEPMVYPGVATMALRIKATQKISGTPPTVEVIARKADYAFLYDGTKYYVKSSNPAWACLHRLINLFGVKFDHVNVDQFLDWANFCDENKYECNYYIDTEMSLSETLTLIARCGRATVVQRGIKYGVIIDRVTQPVQLFTDGNIVAGSFNETYISDEELANVVCVWYSDTKTTSGIATRKAIEVRANNIPVDEEIKRISVEFEGCTNKDDAKKYAIQLLNQTIATTRIVEFIAAIDAIVCEVGDVVMISTNAMDWTIASGRTEVVTSTYFEIDKPIKHHSSYNQYKIRIRKNDPSADSDSLIEMQVTPDIPSDVSQPFTRFNTNIGLNPGDLDDIHSNSFIYSLGAVINDVAVDAKKFRIISIEKESNQMFRIKASEYFDEMYEDDYVINEIETPVVTRDYVSNIKAQINYEYNGTPYVTLTWSGKAIVFYVFYKTGSTWVKFGEVNDTLCNVRGINFAPNEICEFSVSVTDNPNTGVRVSILIPDPHTPLNPDEKQNTSDADYLAITGLEIFGQGNNYIWKERDLKIRWNEIVYDFEGQIDAPAEGASTSNMDMRELRKFRVELYDKNMTPIKDYIVYEPHFELPFDENKDLYKRSIVSNVITTP